MEGVVFIVASVHALSKLDIVRLVDGAQSGSEIKQAKEALYTLQKTFNESVDILPSYDQKSYSGQLAQIGRALSEKEAAVAPKPKFSFKDKVRARQAASESAGKASNAAAAPHKTLDQHLDNQTSASSELAAMDIKDMLHIINGHQGGLTVDRVTNSVLVAASADADSPSSCHIHNVEQSIVNVGRVNGSLFLNNVNHAIIVAESQQVRYCFKVEKD